MVLDIIGGIAVNASRLKFATSLILITLCGCDSQDSELVQAFRVPDRIAMATVPDNALLSANVSVDGQARYRMVFDNLVSEASVSLDGFALEAHEITVTFQYLVRADNVDIATATRIYNPDIDMGLVAFTESDYTWPDDDNDGVSNLDEINNGTY